MERHDFRTQRLYTEADLAAQARIATDPSQANYLLNVLRMKSGAHVLLFNGRDGEWLAQVERGGRKACDLLVLHRTRDQTRPGDLWYLFAPLKQARLDYMVQKAVEMGVSRLVPVLTRHTQIGRVNERRMHANAVEAAEQCGVLALPQLEQAQKLD
ncbi:MAG: RsmE family RNA methyltransferase, partial [Pseudomonadota bacterium]|nr:RsmE family RNA methyltransferase [Pseudomonadota bacterium]